MRAERSPAAFAFGTIESRSVIAAFDGGAVRSDAGAPQLGAGAAVGTALTAAGAGMAAGAGAEEPRSRGADPWAGPARPARSGGRVLRRAS